MDVGNSSGVALTVLILVLSAGCTAAPRPRTAPEAAPAVAEPLARSLCAAIHALPAERRKACCNTSGVSLADFCVLELSAAFASRDRDARRRGDRSLRRGDRPGARRLRLGQAGPAGTDDGLPRSRSRNARGGRRLPVVARMYRRPALPGRVAGRTRKVQRRSRRQNALRNPSGQPRGHDRVEGRPTPPAMPGPLRHGPMPTVCRGRREVPRDVMVPTRAALHRWTLRGTVLCPPRARRARAAAARREPSARTVSVRR